MKKIILLIAALLFIAACTKAPTGSTPASGLVSEEKFVKIPVDDISEEMQMFSYDTGSTEVKYFAVKGSDGKIRTAFDACDVCGGHKGYRQEGEQVVCNNCGTRFDIDDIGVHNTKGGCWPSYLDHTIESGNILIEKQDLEQGSFRFA